MKSIEQIQNDVVNSLKAGTEPPNDYNLFDYLLYLNLFKVYDLYFKGMIDKQGGEQLKRKLVIEYENQISAFDLKEKIYHSNIKLLNEIESCQLRTRLKKSLNKGDEKEALKTALKLVEIAFTEYGIYTSTISELSNINN
ncbi:MAG: hypothetical protein LBS74_02945 [Oscillospiraceae bacterium]|jgi:hypothetical protein|nr:hypothetical protein [Oscillospiraceae bacterium]